MLKDACEKPLNIALIRQRYTDLGRAERFVAHAMDDLRQLELELCPLRMHSSHSTWFNPMNASPAATYYRAGDDVHREWLKQRRRSMSKLLSPSHREQLGATALNSIEPLSLDNMSIKLSSLYESLLNLH